jgi:hypothetical protein
MAVTKTLRAHASSKKMRVTTINTTLNNDDARQRRVLQL